MMMGSFGPFCKGHLVAEDAVLHVARRMIVVVVEAISPQAMTLGRFDSRARSSQMLLRTSFASWGMNADGGRKSNHVVRQMAARNRASPGPGLCNARER